MKLCRFQLPGGTPRVGMVLVEGEEASFFDLTAAGVTSLSTLLEADDPGAEAARLARPEGLRVVDRPEVRLLCPLERQEVWAAGVTYSRSRQARMEESDFSATAYDRVYAAERPELFFKSLPEKAVGPGEPVGLRADSAWTVPEPELALVLNSRGRIAGYTIGNDMSARDLEGDNLLYLPQAKIYDRSCAVGPWIVLGEDEAIARTWTVELVLTRRGMTVFRGETDIGRIKRGFAELAAWLFRSQRFPHGVVLLTGTGIVPPDEFALESGDHIAIRISGIGRLENTVQTV